MGQDHNGRIRQNSRKGTSAKIARHRQGAISLNLRTIPAEHPCPSKPALWLRRSRLAARAERKTDPSEQDLVFATVAGKPLHRKFASQIFDSAITAAEVKRLTLHKLRHTFASLLLSRNVPITKVSRLLGHRDSVITLKVYAHFIEDKKNDMQDLASSILRRTETGET